MKDFLKVPFEDRYNQHIPIQDISIDCFIINQEMVIAPTYLESLLLQTYISFTARLPTANNEL